MVYWQRFRERFFSNTFTGMQKILVLGPFFLIFSCVTALIPLDAFQGLFIILALLASLTFFLASRRHAALVLFTVVLFYGYLLITHKEPLPTKQLFWVFTVVLGLIISYQAAHVHRENATENDAAREEALKEKELWKRRFEILSEKIDIEKKEKEQEKEKIKEAAKEESSQMYSLRALMATMQKEAYKSAMRLLALEKENARLQEKLSPITFPPEDSSKLKEISEMQVHLESLLSEEKKAHREEVLHLEEELTASKEAYFAIKALLEETKEALNEKNQSLVSELEKVSLIKNEEKELKRAKEQLEEYQNQKRLLEKNLEEEQEKYLALKQFLTGLKKERYEEEKRLYEELEKAKEEFHQLEKLFKQTKEDLKEENETLYTDLEQAKEELIRVKSLIDARNQESFLESQSLLIELDASKKECERLQTELAEKRVEFHAHNPKVEEELRQAREDFDRLKALYDEAKEQLNRQEEAAFIRGARNQKLLATSSKKPISLTDIARSVDKKTK